MLYLVFSFPLHTANGDPKATDKSYVEKLIREHSANDKFQKSDFRAKADFILVHYAGTVSMVYLYTCSCKLSWVH